jgi:hypothetical protein
VKALTKPARAFAYCPLRSLFFVNLESGGKMPENESAVGLDHLSHLLTDLVIGHDWGANSDSTVVRDLRSNKPDPTYVHIAMLTPKAEFRRQMLMNCLSIQESNRAAVHLEELNEQDSRDGRLPRT